jgi:hypothetical protein
MDEKAYLEQRLAQLRGFADEFERRTRELPEEDSLRELALAFSRLAAGEGDRYVDGPPLVTRLFTTYPDFAPTFPRELLWFFGGECLHFMPDGEIREFEKRFADNA